MYFITYFRFFYFLVLYVASTDDFIFGYFLTILKFFVFFEVFIRTRHQNFIESSS